MAMTCDRPDADVEHLTRQQIVEAMQAYAQAYDMTAEDVVKLYRRGQLSDVTDYTPLLALSYLLAKSDPLSVG